MFSPTVISTIATLLLCSASPARGLPQATNAVSTSKAIFQRWSSHPDCSAPDTACKGDCTQAVKNLCQKKLGLNEDGKTNYIAETVGECTATYIYELGNTLPDETKCYNTFAYINDEGKPGPDGCGGYFGGVLGWDEKGNRTLDPIYAIQPKSGNPNCFMPPGKEADKPLAMDELPGGTKFEVAQCPMAISRRGPFGDNKSCTVGSSIWFGSCSVVCMAVVASASSWWTFGVGLAVAPALCLGPCGSLAWGVDTACEKLSEEPANKPRMLLDARAANPGPDLCASTESTAIACPALRNTLLQLHRCQGAGLDGQIAAPAGGSGVINT